VDQVDDVVSTTTTDAVAAAHDDASPATLVMTTDARSSSTSAPVADGLDDGDVLRIRVRKLQPGSLARVRQCATRSEGAPCTNAFPVRVGPDGVAFFQYQVRGDAERCSARASCTLVVTDDDGATAIAYTVFGASAPAAAQVSVRPEGPYEAGERVTVHVSPLPPGARLAVAFCRDLCAPVRTMTAGSDGTARASIVLATACGRGDQCVIRVTGLATRDAAVAVRFRAGPSARYENWRVLFGLALAATFAAAARSIIRRTDWRAPTEAATPALDQAAL
jgi:hypothetical protein